MSNSEIIQIMAIIVNATVSIVSIYIAIKSLKQTNKTILNANKSDLAVYSDYMQIGPSRMNYLIIKNFGKTSAIIDNIEFSNNDFYANNDMPFYNLSNCSIAPNQFYSSRVLYKTNPYIPFDVTIKYHDGICKQEKTFKINPESLAKQLVSLTTNNQQTELEKTISTIGQELIRRNF